jgi:hypothetical protein
MQAKGFIQLLEGGTPPHDRDEVFAFLGRAAPDRAGVRPYQLNVQRRIARERIPTPAERLGRQHHFR